MRGWALLAVVAWGCSGGKDEGEPGDCDALTEGAWTLDGSCIGMPMPHTLTLEEDGCSFTLGEWTMPMTVPTGGTVSGAELTLDWPDQDACTGTLTDGTSVEGTCADGCGFTMVFDG
jgi:hypothetical protein